MSEKTVPGYGLWRRSTGRVEPTTMSEHQQLARYLLDNLRETVDETTAVDLDAAREVMADVSAFDAGWRGRNPA